jgi:hypothetical protein
MTRAGPFFGAAECGRAVHPALCDGTHPTLMQFFFHLVPITTLITTAENLAVTGFIYILFPYRYMNFSQV